jgi:ubiquinone/menaquinone biosynthesis C-methylase UbiE
VALDINVDSLGKQHDLGVVADARSLPFSENTFDLIISHASMPHILSTEEAKDFNLIPAEEEKKQKVFEDILSVFREAYRVIKQGGQIRIDLSGNN